MEEGICTFPAPGGGGGGGISEVGECMDIVGGGGGGGINEVEDCMDIVGGGGGGGGMLDEVECISGEGDTVLLLFEDGEGGGGGIYETGDGGGNGIFEPTIESFAFAFVFNDSTIIFNCLI